MKTLALRIAFTVLFATDLRGGDTALPRTLSELDKWYVQPTPGQNGATFVLQGLDALNITSNDFRSSNLPWLGRAQPPRISTRLPAPMGTAISDLVQRNYSALAYFQQAARCEHSRYPLDLSKGPVTPIPHLGKIKHASELLAAYALWRANAGRGREAVEAVALNLRLANSLELEPLLISQTCRSECIVLAVVSLERVLNRAASPTGTLEILQTNLNGLDESVTAGIGLRRGFVGGAVVGASVFDMPLKRLIDIAPQLFSTNSTPREEVTVDPKEYLIDADRQFTAATYEELLTALKDPYPKRLEAVEDICSRRNPTASSEKFVVSAFLIRSFPACLRTDILCLESLRMARTAIALERFRLANNRYPDDLGELVSAYLDTVPLDPFDGNKLRYVKQGHGYLLCSRATKTSFPTKKASEDHITFRVITPPL